MRKHIKSHIEKEAKRVTKGWPADQKKKYKKAMLKMNEETTEIKMLLRPAMQREVKRPRIPFSHKKISITQLLVQRAIYGDLSY